MRRVIPELSQSNSDYLDVSNPQFRVTGQLTLPSRRLFALRGEIVAGTIRPGMLVEFNGHEAFGISAPKGCHRANAPSFRVQLARELSHISETTMASVGKCSGGHHLSEPMQRPNGAIP